VSADAITYCLEQLSDYRQFERLCSALLASAGYSTIDPLGGTGDEGRDAIIRTDSAGRTICFAYTVCADWRIKLRSDCKRVTEAEHKPDVFVFACTEAIAARDKDAAVKMVKDDFGWRLDLFDLERLRVQLSGPQRHLLAQHPSIFVPPFFPQRGGESIADSHDTILIDHVTSDHAIAAWLSRRLSLAGFRIWCRGTAPLAGEDADETVRTLIAHRANRYLPILSSASLADPLFLERCAIATARSQDLVIPCKGIISEDWALPSRLTKLVAADFSSSWREGLNAVLDALSSSGIRPSLAAERGAQIALRDFLPSQVTIAKPEPVFANVFSMTVPTSMLDIGIPHALTMAERYELSRKWAFYIANEYTLIAFDLPPSDSCLGDVSGRYSEFSWHDAAHIHGHPVINVAKFLLRRSLDVACETKGLVFCHDRKGYHYTRDGEQELAQAITHVDGQKTTVQLTGKRTKGYGERASEFRYQLGPRFRCDRDKQGHWTAVIRLYVRVTTLEGAIFEGKEINRRRKVVTKSWWNKQWLARLLGVVQGLETHPGKVSVGNGHRAVTMTTAPMRWECPVGLDVSALTDASEIGQEMALYRARQDGEDDTDDAGMPTPTAILTTP
jgi:hypothetical protein